MSDATTPAAPTLTNAWLYGASATFQHLDLPPSSIAAERRAELSRPYRPRWFVAPFHPRASAYGLPRAMFSRPVGAVLIGALQPRSVLTQVRDWFTMSKQKGESEIEGQLFVPMLVGGGAGEIEGGGWEVEF